MRIPSRGGVAEYSRALDLKYGDCLFTTPHLCHLMGVCFVIPNSTLRRLVNSQLTSLSIGFLTSCQFNLQYCFSSFISVPNKHSRAKITSVVSRVIYLLTCRDSHLKRLEILVIFPRNAYQGQTPLLLVLSVSFRVKQ